MALTKPATTTLVTPAVPGSPAIDAIPFWLYATPPPLGFAYRPLASAAGFSSWAQLFEPPLGVSSTVGGYWRLTVAQLASGELGYTSIAFPAGTKDVYGTVDGVFQLIAWDIPKLVTAPLPPQWYGPIGRMTYVSFPSVTTAPNGYPLVDGVVAGRFTVPTVSGPLTVIRNYVKNSQAVWVPQVVYPNPPLCRIGGSCRVTMLEDFPGAPAIPGTPAEYFTDDHAGWNAGANSELALDGDLHVLFNVDIAAGVAVGFCANRDDVTRYDNLTHAFYFDTSLAGAPQYRLLEEGRQVRGAATIADPDSDFEIQRLAGEVSYLVDDIVVYVSQRPSYGELQVGSVLYRAGDSLP